MNSTSLARWDVKPPTNSQQQRQPTAANTSAAARARTHSLLVHRIITQERCCCAHKGTRAALAALGLLGTAVRARRFFSYARTHTPLSPPSALSASQHARSALFLFRETLLATRSAFILATHSQRIAPRPHTNTHARPRTDDRYSQRIELRLNACRHARARTDDQRRTTRRAVRRLG